MIRGFWLLMAFIGAIIPYYFFAQQFAATGLDVIAFIKALFVNGASGGFASDLLITSFVFWVWMFTEKEKLQTSRVAFLMLLNLTIGLSCALPMYFWMKSKKVR